MPIDRHWFRRFAVRGVFWRDYLDFGTSNVPFYQQPIIVFFWTIFFYFVALPARRAVLANLRVIFPRSTRFANHGRAFVTFHNFAWTITDAADHKLCGTEFAYAVEGAEYLERLAATRGAILLTAHMGSYDLGAAVFARRFGREIRMVRAPEKHQETAAHLDRSLEQVGAGAVKVSYHGAGVALPLELLNAVRQGEIVSLQGDRVVGNVSAREARLFGEPVRLPDGPFMLAFVTQAPIFPLFIVRSSYHRYKIIACEPIDCVRTARSREAAIDQAMSAWCRTLEKIIARHWSQWFSFVPLFTVG